jgi:hypothetical protein
MLRTAALVLLVQLACVADILPECTLGMGAANVATCQLPSSHPAYSLTLSPPGPWGLLGGLADGDGLCTCSRVAHFRLRCHRSLDSLCLKLLQNHSLNPATHHGGTREQIFFCSSPHSQARRPNRSRPGRKSPCPGACLETPPCASSSGSYTLFAMCPCACTGSMLGTSMLIPAAYAGPLPHGSHATPLAFPSSCLLHMQPDTAMTSSELLAADGVMSPAAAPPAGQAPPASHPWAPADGASTTSSAPQLSRAVTSTTMVPPTATHEWPAYQAHVRALYARVAAEYQERGLIFSGLLMDATPAAAPKFFRLLELCNNSMLSIPAVLDGLMFACHPDAPATLQRTKFIHAAPGSARDVPEPMARTVILKNLTKAGFSRMVTKLRAIPDMQIVDQGARVLSHSAASSTDTGGVFSVEFASAAMAWRLRLALLDVDVYASVRDANPAGGTDHGTGAVMEIDGVKPAPGRIPTKVILIPRPDSTTMGGRTKKLPLGVRSRSLHDALMQWVLSSKDSTHLAGAVQWLYWLDHDHCSYPFGTPDSCGLEVDVVTDQLLLRFESQGGSCHISEIGVDVYIVSEDSAHYTQERERLLTQWGASGPPRAPLGSVTISIVVACAVRAAELECVGLVVDELLSVLYSKFPDLRKQDLTYSNITFHPLVKDGYARSTVSTAFLLTLPSIEIAMAAVDLSGLVHTWLPTPNLALSAADVSAALAPARASARHPHFVYSAPSVSVAKRSTDSLPGIQAVRLAGWVSQVPLIGIARDSAAELQLGSDVSSYITRSDWPALLRAAHAARSTVKQQADDADRKAKAAAEAAAAAAAKAAADVAHGVIGAGVAAGASSSASFGSSAGAGRGFAFGGRAFGHGRGGPAAWGGRGGRGGPEKRKMGMSLEEVEAADAKRSVSRPCACLFWTQSVLLPLLAALSSPGTFCWYPIATLTLAVSVGARAALTCMLALNTVPAFSAVYTLLLCSSAITPLFSTLTMCRPGRQVVRASLSIPAAARQARVRVLHVGRVSRQTLVPALSSAAAFLCCAPLPFVAACWCTCCFVAHVSATHGISTLFAAGAVLTAGPAWTAVLLLLSNLLPVSMWHASAGWAFGVWVVHVLVCPGVCTICAAAVLGLVSRWAGGQCVRYVACLPINVCWISVPWKLTTEGLIQILWYPAGSCTFVCVGTDSGNCAVGWLPPLTLFCNQAGACWHWSVPSRPRMAAYYWATAHHTKLSAALWKRHIQPVRLQRRALLSALRSACHQHVRRSLHSLPHLAYHPATQPMGTSPSPDRSQPPAPAAPQPHPPYFSSSMGFCFVHAVNALAGTCLCTPDQALLACRAFHDSLPAAHQPTFVSHCSPYGSFTLHAMNLVLSARQAPFSLTQHRPGSGMWQALPPAPSRPQVLAALPPGCTACVLACASPGLHVVCLRQVGTSWYLLDNELPAPVHLDSGAGSPTTPTPAYPTVPITWSSLHGCVITAGPPQPMPLPGIAPSLLPCAPAPGPPPSHHSAHLEYAGVASCCC